jgi:UDP-3-O-[3-hydroxymyristoyl] N-acetylglucosamine deacetylase
MEALIFSSAPPFPVRPERPGATQTERLSQETRLARSGMERVATTQPRGQRTLRNPIGCVGTGLHTGARVSLTLHPAEPDSGIRFVRYDRPGRSVIAARFDLVCDTAISTVLGNLSGTMVGTVEHLMGALAICEIDNVLVEVGGPELPIMDGSAQPFVFLIECAGIVEQARPRRWIEVLKPVQIEAHGKFARLEPADRLIIDCELHIEHPLVDSQGLRIAFDAESFKAEIARARTFGFAERVEDLWSRGLALGGSLKNTVVVSRDRILNEEGLRFPDELVRHKILDTLGDLYLAAAPLVGRFTGRSAGPTLHNKLLRALFGDPGSWRMVDASGPIEPEVPLALAAQA